MKNERLMSMDTLDDMLASVASAPTPSALDTIDARVFARLAARSANRGPSITAFGGAAVVALVMGVATAGLSAEHGSKPPELAALSAQSAYAPSTLLGQ